MALAIVLGAAVFVFTVVDSYAGLIEDNSNTNQQAQGQLQGQAQGQLQGQIANGEVKVEGDDTDVAASFSWPTNMVAPGVSSITAASPFGSAGIGDSELYVSIPVAIQQIQAAVQAGYISQDEAQGRIYDLLRDLQDSVKPKKLFGLVGGRIARGRHLFNLGGILCW